MQHKPRVRTLAAAAALFAALAGATPSAAAPPRAGLFVPGESLGGVALGMTKSDVTRAWGTRHGLCRSCLRTTWYFNYERFRPQGAGVTFRQGRVARVFTIWKPAGWRTQKGLELGAPASEVALAHGPVRRQACDGYVALTAWTEAAQSVFYVYQDSLWGFALTRPGASACG